MKPKRTKQVAGMIIGSLLMLGTPIVAGILFAHGMLGALGSPGDNSIAYSDQLQSDKLQSDLHAAIYIGRWINALSVFGFVVLIISVVWFVRAGRAIPATPTP